MYTNQKISVKGRLVESPEIKTAEQSGNSYFTVPVAVNFKSKNKDGELEEQVTYYTAICYGKLAESNQNRLKGQYVFITGNFHLKPYESKNGKEKFDPTIHVDEFLAIMPIDDLEEKESSDDNSPSEEVENENE